MPNNREVWDRSVYEASEEYKERMVSSSTKKCLFVCLMLTFFRWSYGGHQPECIDLGGCCYLSGKAGMSESLAVYSQMGVRQLLHVRRSYDIDVTALAIHKSMSQLRRL